MLKFPPTDRYDIIALRWLAGVAVIVVLVYGAGAVIFRHLDTLGVVSASCYGIGLLIAVYGLVWGRQHAKLIIVLVSLAMCVGIIASGLGIVVH